MIFALQTIAEPLPVPHFFAGKVPVSLRIWQTEVVSRKIPTGRSNESRCKVAIAERHRRCRFRLKMDRYLPGELSYSDEMAQIREFIEIAGEYGLAYEYINCALERHPYKIYGKIAIKLLEVRLLMGFKSGRENDKRLDRR